MTHESRDGRDVHYGPAAGFLHLRYRVFHAQKYALGIDIHQPVPRVCAGDVGFSAAADTGVVDQDVQFAKPGHHLGHRTRPLVFLSHVQHEHHRFAAGLGDLRFNLAGIVFSYIGDGYLGAFPGEKTGLFGPHSVGRARDQSDLSFQSHPSSTSASSKVTRLGGSGCPKSYSL